MEKNYTIRILHVVGAMNRAGTETMLMNIYRNIDRDKVQFDFISYQQEDAHYDEEIKQMGGRVIKLSKTTSVKEIYDVIKKYGPYAAVHSHTLFHCGISSLAAKLAVVKIRISHAHTTSDYSDTVIRKLYISSMRCLINIFSTNLLSCSREAGRYLFGDNALLKPKYSYFPNLIDYSKFLRGQKEEADKFKIDNRIDGKIVIGHIGRFIEPKNHRFLIDVLECLLKKEKDIILLLVGDGDLRLEVEEIAKQKGVYDNIRFVGLRDDIPILLQTMDVFVFPSIYEGLGLVLLEAQACGLPCVVSEAIQPEADLNINLVSKLNLIAGSKVWSDKILELIGKKENKTEIIIEGFEKKEYSLTIGISKLMNIYNIPMEGI